MVLKVRLHSLDVAPRGGHLVEAQEIVQVTAAVLVSVVGADDSCDAVVIFWAGLLGGSSDEIGDALRVHQARLRVLVQVVPLTEDLDGPRDELLGLGVD